MTLRGLARSAAPSLAASVLGALVAGALDGVVNTASPVAALAATGYVAWLLVPAGVVVSLIGRALWKAWRPDEVVAATSDPDGACPRLAAWALFLLAALGALGSATFALALAALHRTPSKVVVALVAAFAAGALAVVLALASRPAVRGLTALFRRLERGRARPLLRPRRVVVATLVAAALAAALGWRLGVAPLIGDLDLAPLGYLGAGAAAFVALHLAWREVRSLRLGLALSALLVACGAAGLWLREQRPFTMLEVWGDTHLAGPAIDRLYDLDALRADLDLEEIRPVARPGAPHPDIVLVTIDTFRADRASIYGGPAPMPALRELARDGAVFDWAFAPGNVTRRSLPSMALGLSPARVRGRVAGWALRLDPRHVPFAERLRAGGYATAGFVCCGSHFDPVHRLGLNRGLEHLVIDKDGAVLAARAAEWLARDPAAPPRFAWFHFIEPHLWETDAVTPGSDPRKRYDRALAVVDGHLGAIRRAFAGTGRPTYVVVTSDHGEALGDHGERTHATDLYNSQIRVPLVVAGPGVRAGRIAEPVGLVRLAPTLIELAGFAPPGMPEMDGRSLAGRVLGRELAEIGEAYSMMVIDRSVARGATALVVGQYKLIIGPRTAAPQLYDLARDPHEKKDLAASRPEVTRRLLDRLGQLRTIDAVPPFPGGRRAIDGT